MIIQISATFATTSLFTTHHMANYGKSCKIVVVVDFLKEEKKEKN